MTKRKVGIALISVSLVFSVMERATFIFSTWLGKITCGANYLKPVDGKVGDMSCGFNSDMHLISILLCFLILGVYCFKTGKT